MKKIYILFTGLFLLAAQSIIAQTFTGIDIWPSAGSSTPRVLTSFNGKVYFQAEADTLHGVELWVSDGTQGGTMMLKDIWPGPGSSYPYNFTAVGTKLFFAADDSMHGTELWVTDGTSAGTVMVDDIWAGPTSSYPGVFTSFNGKLYLSANDNIHGQELWVSDGTQAGTSLVKDIWSGSGSSSPFGSALGSGGQQFVYILSEFNSKLYFRANDSIHGNELWTSDGTTLGTTLVADIWPGPESGSPYCIYTLNGNMIFAARGDSLNGFELWTSDGTGVGTSLLKNIAPNSVSSNSTGADVADYSGFTGSNTKAYFSAYQPSTGYEMWVTDGTTIGTTLVADIWPGPGSSDAGYWGIQSFNGNLYFIANDSVHGSELWTSNGTNSGTTLLKNITTYPYYANLYDPHMFTIYNNRIIFRAAIDSTNLEQLFGSDGTAAGTHILAPTISPNTNPLGTYSTFAIANGSLFVNADFNSIGDELWVYTTPTGITPVSGENAISAYPNPFSSTVTLSGLESSGQYTVQVLDMIGCEHFSTVINNPAQNTSITMPDLSTGVYLMRVSGQGTGQTFKLVKN